MEYLKEDKKGKGRMSETDFRRILKTVIKGKWEQELEESFIGFLKEPEDPNQAPGPDDVISYRKLTKAVDMY